MSSFEFLSVLISVVVGLGMANLLTVETMCRFP
jgi:hypothetical protein